MTATAGGNTTSDVENGGGQTRRGESMAEISGGGGVGANVGHSGRSDGPVADAGFGGCWRTRAVDLAC